MKKILLVFIAVLLFAAAGADAQQGSRKSFRINDSLFVDFIAPDSNAVIAVLGNVSITGTLYATVANTDSLAHKSIQQIYVIMRDTSNKAIRDSLSNHYKKADIRAIISDSLNTIDSTKVVNGKLGIGDVNNLWNLINARALLTAMVDSLGTKATDADVAAAIFDSTHFPLDTLELIGAQWDAYVKSHQSSGGAVIITEVFGALDSLAAKVDTGAVLDDNHVADNITIAGTLNVVGLNDSLSAKASPVPIDTSEIVTAEFTAFVQDHQSSAADTARAASYADSAEKAPIATGAVRGTVVIGAGLSVTAGGTISVSGTGGAAYTDSVTKNGHRVPGDSMGTEAQILSAVQKYLYVPMRYVADTSLTIGASDSMDVFLDTESSETVIVARAKSTAAGIQNLTFQTFIENPQSFSTLDSLHVSYKTTHASADSQKVNIYAGTLNRFTGAVTLTDSATGLSGAAYVSQRLYVGDSSIGKDAVVIVRFRVWSINNSKAVRIKRVYLVYGA